MATDPDLHCFKNHAAIGELPAHVKQKQREALDKPPF
jgi:hypothetical protein